MRRPRFRLMNPSPTQWAIIGTAGALTLGLATAAYAARRAKKGIGPSGPVLPPGKRDPDVDPNLPGSGEIVPGPNNQGPPPLPNGWGGGQYGPGPIPEDFDWGGNLVYISGDCRTIAEGWLFLPVPGFQLIENWWMPNDGGPSGQGTLADALRYVNAGTGATGTAWGYVARLVARRARDGNPIDVDEIALLIYEELAEMQATPPSCPHPLDKKAMKNAPAFKAWWDSLTERIGAGIDAFEDNWYFWNEYWEVV